METAKNAISHRKHGKSSRRHDDEDSEYDTDDEKKENKGDGETQIPAKSARPVTLTLAVKRKILSISRNMRKTEDMIPKIQTMILMTRRM